ncbi:Transmembrane 9 superfamily member 3 [Tritrichomonas foetus]|uniref:Transmembrane 9 superfamily member n=1 Tax=Tritrichomonas foetus TaxID=1144522 RepID=A0A1J4J7Q7_9EUKA|nr:Transmembrane 9 superfamily member 3 [Tritrichomonas foetus]|eukprot:OHS94697.1 Transmembrane 9 superfamily member 3 [Tritrichomonas foetus]
MLILLIFLFKASIARTYNEDDVIIAYASKIGPEDNPAEYYPIKNFPIFQNSKIDLKPSPRRSLDDIIFGNCLTDVGFHFNFKKNINDQIFAEIDLNNQNNANILNNAIQNSYWIQLFIDDLPVFYHIGNFQNGVSQIYQKVIFNIDYNDRNEIIEINVTTSSPKKIADNIKLTFSVNWIQTNRNYNDRSYKYTNDEFFKHPIHKYSLINSGLLVFLLIVLIILLLNRISAREYNRLIQDAAFDSFEVDINSEKGWKALHGDVFRPPFRLSPLSMICGAGTQFFVFLLVFSMLNSNKDGIKAANNGLSFGLIIYIITSPVCGFAAVTFGRAFGVLKWLRIALGSSCIIPFIYFTSYLLASFFNISTSFSLSFSYIIILLMLYILLILPLNGVGGYLAIKAKLFEINKCEVSLVPRQIPRPQFYSQTKVLKLSVGLVCTASIITEVYYILSTMWHNVGLYAWGYLAISVIELSAVASCATIFAIYLLLQSENHHWQWPAFAAPATTGLFIFLYSIYYLFWRTQIHGISQIIFYLANMAAFSAAISVLAGGVGYLACMLFVHKIFSNMKLD